MAKELITVFEPTNEGFSQSDLEELRTYPELQNIKGAYLEFAWYYGNKSSPLCNTTPLKEKINKCLIKSKLIGLLSLEEKANYLNADFSPELQAAINKMGEFDSGLRHRANTINNKIFGNFEKIIDRNVSAMEDTEELKKYVSICCDIVKQMPDLIKQIESNYGVKTKHIKGQNEEGLMDIAMRSEN